MNTNSRNGNIDYENRGRLDLTEFSKKAEPLGILGLVVTQDGEERAKHLWDEECRRNVYSASKSFTSCAVGFALQEGLLGTERVFQRFAERGQSESEKSKGSGFADDSLEEPSQKPKICRERGQ